MTKFKVARIHEIAQLFPMMTDDELAVLAKSITLNGLLTPITHDPNGVLLDGRNRLEACKMAGVEPKFVIYDGDPVQYILSVNVARRQLNAGQCAVLCALAYPEPRQRGRKSSIASKVETFVPKPEWFSASRLSEARTIIKHSRDLADQVIRGSCTFKQALDEATTIHIVNTDPPTPPTIVTSAELRAAAARHRENDAAQKREDLQRKKCGETENERRREALAARIAYNREAAAQTEPEAARMKNPIEDWLFDWEPDRLAHRVIEADRLSPGYAQNVVDAIILKMGAPPVMMH